MRFVVFAMLGCLAGTPVAVSAQNDDVTISLLDRATVLAGSTYLVRDVARVTAGESETKGRLEAVSVGVAPRMGYSRTVTRAALERAVASQWPQMADRIVWQGGDSLVIRGQGIRYEPASLVVVAHKALSAQLSEIGFRRTEITPVGAMQELRLPPGKVSVIHRDTSVSPLAPRMRVWLDISIDGRHYRSMPVWFGVKAYAPVRVARRSMGPRQRISEGDFRVEERDVAGIRGVPVPIQESLGSAWLKRSLRAGDVLVDASMESAPLIERGDDVTVKVSMGAIHIETKGVALANGRLGDVIEVENPGSRAAFSGKVIGERSILISGEW